MKLASAIFGAFMGHDKKGTAFPKPHSVCQKVDFQTKMGLCQFDDFFFPCRQVKDPFAPQPLQSTWTDIFSFGFDWLVEMALREGHGWSWCRRHSTQFQSSFTRPHWVLPSKTIMSFLHVETWACKCRGDDSALLRPSFRISADW